MLATAPPAPLLPDAPPGVSQPATVDHGAWPRMVTLPGYAPDGHRVPGVRIKVVFGSPGGYAPGGVRYFVPGTR